jgi:HD-GYP domain-containing protein (c-di-GMP phosphodiesterase class II)
LQNAIEARDEYTKWLSVIVAELSYRIAKHLQLPEKQTQKLYWAAVVHDVGKIGVPEHILLKKSVLTEEEFKALKQHTVIGAKILEPICSFKSLIPAVYHHHDALTAKASRWAVWL